jgi:hypothetical protein
VACSPLDGDTRSVLSFLHRPSDESLHQRQAVQSSGRAALHSLPCRPSVRSPPSARAERRHPAGCERVGRTSNTARAYGCATGVVADGVTSNQTKQRCLASRRIVRGCLCGETREGLRLPWCSVRVNSAHVGTGETACSRTMLRAVEPRATSRWVSAGPSQESALRRGLRPAQWLQPVRAGWSHSHLEPPPCGGTRGKQSMGFWKPATCPPRVSTWPCPSRWEVPGALNMSPASSTPPARVHPPPAHVRSTDSYCEQVRTGKRAGLARAGTGDDDMLSRAVRPTRQGSEGARRDDALG